MTSPDLFLQPQTTWTPALLHLRWTGWVMIAGYLVAAFLCFKAWRSLFRRDPHGWNGIRQALSTSLETLVGVVRRTGVPDNRRFALLWFLAGASLAFLAVNRLLGLDAWMTAQLRSVALTGGWYRHRRIIQLMTLTLLAGGIVLAWPVRRRKEDRRSSAPELYVALAGSVLLLGYMAIKACSYHYMDELLAFPLGPFHLGGIAEFAGITAVVVAAFRFPYRIVPLDREDRTTDRRPASSDLASR